ncbi:IS30 family transposase [Akkermansiaceae bacterium]|nr:IS30 family transposase [Akkermansiaceae bacterium]
MKYTQLSQQERYQITALRMEKKSFAEIGRRMGRAGSTISREHRRNRSPWDNMYRASHAQNRANKRRRESRSGTRFSREQHREVKRLLRRNWSPEQVSGYLRRMGELRISHETIYQWVLKDKILGGSLWKHLRGSRKKRRKRYGAYDSRGRLAGKRMIDERPQEVASRKTLGHWEIDTVHGSGKHSVVTLVERKSGYVEIGKISAVTMLETNRSMLGLIGRHYRSYRSITSDNGCEFHGYGMIERITGIPFYFAHPHHSWERGTNENTNGLIRQYLPKGKDLRTLTQQRCDAIAKKLNDRPRKRLGYRTPSEVFMSKT